MRLYYDPCAAVGFYTKDDRRRCPFQNEGRRGNFKFARDLLVDEEAMEKALAGGKVKRYVTDFPNARTANLEHVIAIPHLGASTEESEDNCAVMAVRELRDYIENGNITHSVNYPDCTMGVCTCAGRIAVNHRNIPI